MVRCVSQLTINTKQTEIIMGKIPSNRNLIIMSGGVGVQCARMKWSEVEMRNTVLEVGEENF